MEQYQSKHSAHNCVKITPFALLKYKHWKLYAPKHIWTHILAFSLVSHSCSYNSMSLQSYLYTGRELVHNNKIIHKKGRPLYKVYR